MKKSALKFSILFLLTLFISCDGSDDRKDNTGDPSTGFFAIDNVSFDLNQGYNSEVFEDSPGLYYQSFLIGGDGLFFNPASSSLSGMTNVVIIELYSETDNFDFKGSYEITDGDPVAGQALAYYALDYDVDQSTSRDEEDIESGTLFITTNSNGTFSVSLTNGVVDITRQAFAMEYDGTIKLVRN
jgi:hypothetical protein